MDRSRPGRILAVIGVVIALVIAGWGLWTVTHPAKTPAKATASAPARATAKRKAEQVDMASKADMETAVAVEHAMRDWGTDPTIDPAGLAMKGSAEVLSTLRTPAPGARPAALSFIGASRRAGPDAPTEWCREGQDGLCADMGTFRSWLTNEVWGVGSRWTATPKATAQAGGVVRVTGTVRSILVTRGDRLTGAGWSLLTPAWRDHSIDDLVTVRNGVAVKVIHMGDDDWWNDPWLDDWTSGDVVESMDGGTRVAIPVVGTLSFDGMNPSGLTGSLTCPGTFADMDGRIDWSLTEDLPVTAGQTDRGGQQPDDVDPERDAATIHERE